MIVPQPFQYQGSKRSLAPIILRHLPMACSRLVEPFAGSAALSIACAAKGQARQYWINDYNRPLAALLDLVIHHPNDIADAYESVWTSDSEKALQHYYHVRDAFNKSHAPALFLYLLARCVKGSVRYNAEGLFNQSPDKRRLGTRPNTMRRNIRTVSGLLRGRTLVTSLDYKDVLANVHEDDVVYMDPPYQGVCGERDSRYVTGVSHEEFVDQLNVLNQKNIRYLVSYDGRLGSRSYGAPLPRSLNLTLIELEAGRSSQATLLGRDDVTVESLYLSSRLTAEIGAESKKHKRKPAEQLRLLDQSEHYGKTNVPARVP